MSNRINKQKPVNQDTLYTWMRLLERCIKQRDYEAAKTLFHEQTVSFEAKEHSRYGLESLEKQWRIDWPSTVQFEFDLEHAAIIPASPVWIIATTWSHRGFIIGSDPVSGRATFALAKFESGIKCVHSHLSLNP